MSRLAIGLLATSFVIGAASAALAAAPTAFRATGIFHSTSAGDAQSVHLTIAFRSGHVRIETDSKEAGRSIILATKGKDDVAMLDPMQKVVIHMKPSLLAAANGADAGGFSSYRSLLDPTGIEAFIRQRGREIGPGPGILGHSTTVYEADRKGNEMKVWMANDLSLPLKIEGQSTTGGKFDVEITGLSLHPSFGAHEFDETPPGYTDIKAEPNSPSR